MSSVLARLDLHLFRSHRSLRLDVDSRPVVLTGPNGAGKTNILEAISFLSPGRGLRGSRLSEIRSHPAEGSEPWAVAALFQGKHGPLDIGTSGDKDSEYGAERRIIYINGQTMRAQSALAEHIAITWVTPAMDRLFLEGASERRRFLDRLVFAFDPSHAGRLTRYEKALRERSRVLKDHPTEKTWLDALEDDMARTGVAIAASRRELMEHLDTIGHSVSTGFPSMRLILNGTPEDWLDHEPALAVEDRLRQALAEFRTISEKPGDLPASPPGPHRTDWSAVYVEKNMPAAMCSTGEQKTLLLSIILAHTRLMAQHRGYTPLILLDEIAAHLDPHRRAMLVRTLKDFKTQVWMTGTEPQAFESWDQDALFVRLNNGQCVIQNSR